MKEVISLGDLTAANGVGNQYVKDRAGPVKYRGQNV